MYGEKILRKTGLSPKAFCPGCWHHVKKLLRVVEGPEPSTRLMDSVLTRLALEVTTGETSGIERLLKLIPARHLQAYNEGRPYEPE